MIAIQLPRWLRVRFGLRTLFVFMAIICLWLAWEKSHIDKRRRMLARLEALSGNTWEPYANSITITATRTTFSTDAKPSASEAPWPRRMLGDVAVRSLCLPPEMTQQEMAEYQAAFPEASIGTGSQRTPTRPEKWPIERN